MQLLDYSFKFENSELNLARFQSDRGPATMECTPFIVSLWISACMGLGLPRLAMASISRIPLPS